MDMPINNNQDNALGAVIQNDQFAEFQNSSNSLLDILSGNVIKRQYETIDNLSPRFSGIPFKIRALDVVELENVTYKSIERDDMGRLVLNDNGGYAIRETKLAIEVIIAGCTYPDFKNIDVQKACGVQMDRAEAVANNHANAVMAVRNVLKGSELSELADRIVTLSNGSVALDEGEVKN